MTDTLVLPYSRSLLYSKAPFHCPFSCSLLLLPSRAGTQMLMSHGGAFVILRRTFSDLSLNSAPQVINLLRLWGSAPFSLPSSTKVGNPIYTLLCLRSPYPNGRHSLRPLPRLSPLQPSPIEALHLTTRNSHISFSSQIDYLTPLPGALSHSAISLLLHFLTSSVTHSDSFGFRGTAIFRDETISHS